MKRLLQESIFDVMNARTIFLHDSIYLLEQAYKFVLDDGPLLHHLPWPKGITYMSVCDLYIEYVRRRYTGNVTVLFNGYNDYPSTKDCTHLRRTGICGQEVMT